MVDPFRRLVLALIAAIAIARPFVLAEHPGYLSDFADPGSMTLTFLTLVAVTLWAVWRVVRGQLALYLNGVDLAVFALGLLVFLAASWAGYPRSAWLAGWDWLGLALFYLLVRQFAITPMERHGWLAVLLALGVTISVEAVYQSLSVLPKQAAAEEDYRYKNAADDATAYFRTEAFLRGLQATPLELHQQATRLEQRQVSGPYFHPTSLATVLSLTLPLAVGAVLASMRNGSPPWQIGLAVLGAGFVIAALWLTGVALVFLLVGSAALAFVAGWFVRRPLGAILALLIILGDLALVVWQIPETLEVWQGTWRLLQDHFWLGVGPAQFLLVYPRYLLETAGGKLAQPGGMIFDVWVNAGFLGVVALLAALVLLVRAVWNWHYKEEIKEPDTPKNDTPNWEFYLGGMLGLVLGFVLRARALPPEDILNEAILSGLRAIAWFAAFALYEGIAWSVTQHLGALLTGAGAMALTLLVGAGIDFSSVAIFLWIALALIQATVSPVPAAWLSRQSAVGLISIPLSVAVAFGYFAFTFYPAARSAVALRTAQLDGLYYYSEMRQPRDQRTITDPPEYLRRKLLTPIEQAIQEDPENVRLMAHLANWYGHLYELTLNDARYAGQGEVKYWKAALQWPPKARKTAPQLFLGYQAESELRQRFASILNTRATAAEKEKPEKKLTREQEIQRQALIASWRREAQAQFQYAADLLKQFLEYDPRDPKLRYDIASAEFSAGRLDQGRRYAEEARQLNALARPPRSLPDQQRDQLDKWLEPESKK